MSAFAGASAPLVHDSKASPACGDEEHHHGHGHSHGHSHAEEEVKMLSKRHGHDEADAKAAAAIRQLSWAIALCFFFMIAEAVGGYFSGSIAIMTDAAHMLSDVASLLIG